jgi:hypothetical protein
MVENLSSQLPTLDKYIGRIKRQQTEDKDCLKWDIEVSCREREREKTKSIIIYHRKVYLIFRYQIWMQH